jgi:2-oxoacid:acceptor oxidoreductase delta subunit (pyruvate/2-ketoisovalerate family)
MERASDASKLVSSCEGRMVKSCDREAQGIQKGGRSSRRRKKHGVALGKSGLREREAIQEARRCLGWRECESCEVCTLFCPDLCITRDEKTGQILIDLDYCKGCGICASVCPKGAIQMVLEEEER